MKEHKEYYNNGQLHRHYWRNEKRNMEGEYKSWHESGQLAIHCFFKNGMSQGEYKLYYRNEPSVLHCFYNNNKLVDISEYAADINDITEQEYFLLQITFGYFPILKYNGKL